METVATKRYLYVVKDLGGSDPPRVCGVEIEKETADCFFVTRPTAYFNDCRRFNKQRYAHRIHFTPEEAIAAWLALAEQKVKNVKRSLEMAEEDLEYARNLQKDFTVDKVLYPREY